MERPGHATSDIAQGWALGSVCADGVWCLARKIGNDEFFPSTRRMWAPAGFSAMVPVHWMLVAVMCTSVRPRISARLPSFGSGVGRCRCGWSQARSTGLCRPGLDARQRGPAALHVLGALPLEMPVDALLARPGSRTCWEPHDEPEYADKLPRRQDEPFPDNPSLRRMSAHSPGECPGALSSRRGGPGARKHGTDACVASGLRRFLTLGPLPCRWASCERLVLWRVGHGSYRPLVHVTHVDGV